jgi:hypothetical protein
LVIWQTWPVTSREDIHRLVDALPSMRLPGIEKLLRATLAASEPAMPRSFASTGALSAEHDLAERSEEILRSDSVDGDLGEPRVDQ